MIQGRESEQRLALPDLDATWSDARLVPGRSCSGRVVADAQSADQLELVLRCTPTLHGPLHDTLWLQREQPKQRLAVIVEGRVTPLLIAVPPMVDLSVPFGEDRAQLLRFSGELALGAHIELQGAVPDFLSVEESTDGVFSILSRAKSVGAHNATLEFATGLTEPSVVQVPVRVRVAGTLDVVPSNPYINLRGSGDKSVRLAVSSKQPDFKLRSASVRSGPFRVEVEKASPGKANPVFVVVSLVEERVTPNVRGAFGEIILRSNDRTEPEKRVKVFGFGKPSVR